MSDLYLSKVSLNQLKAKLPSDYVAKLEKKTGLSKSTIGNCMNNRKYNSEVITAAIELVKEIAAGISDQENEIANLPAMQIPA